MNENVLFVPPSIKALDLLCEMQAKRTQMVIVVDKYGGTDGVITLEDLNDFSEDLREKMAFVTRK